jgi:hypothetical protein
MKSGDSPNEASETSQNPDSEFNKWRREWLVKKAKERSSHGTRESNPDMDNGFWYWYMEKSAKLHKRYMHLYDDITAKEFRKNKEGIDESNDDIDYIRQQFLKQDRETVKLLADKLAKVGLEKESKEFLSLKPMHKETIQKLDRFFEVLHSKHYNDLEIIDFYLSLSPEERMELGCKP